MKEYLYEIRDLDEKIKNKLEYIKHNSDMKSNNINEIKALKTLYMKRHLRHSFIILRNLFK